MSEPSELEIKVSVVGDGVGTLDWELATDADSLQAAVSAVADDALVGQGLRRLEVSLPAEDQLARRAVLRSGFRLEGTRRQALRRGDGSHGDVVIFARLASDVVYGRDGFSGVMNSALPRKRLIAHVLITDEQGRILLCETRFKPDWELPGGIVEPGEPPRVGAVREVREELGIDRDLGRLLVADWMPPYLGWDDALELIFDGGTVTDDDLVRFSLQASEIARVELVTLEQAATLVTPLSHRRLTVALGVPPGSTAYLENGSAPS